MQLNENDADRAARQRAYRLADSGRFGAPHDVEQAMIAEGWPNARRVMHSDYVHQAVEERCMAASKTHA